MENVPYDKIGLLVNTAAAILLAIGSSKATNVLAKFVDIIRGTYGTYAMGQAKKPVEDLAVEFEKAKKYSVWLNLAGWALFTIGFVLQLF